MKLHTLNLTFMISRLHVAMRHHAPPPVQATWSCQLVCLSCAHTSFEQAFRSMAGFFLKSGPILVLRGLMPRFSPLTPQPVQCLTGLAVAKKQKKMRGSGREHILFLLPPFQNPFHRVRAPAAFSTFSFTVPENPHTPSRTLSAYSLQHASLPSAHDTAHMASSRSCQRDARCEHGGLCMGLASTFGLKSLLHRFSPAHNPLGSTTSIHIPTCAMSALLSFKFSGSKL